MVTGRELIELLDYIQQNREKYGARRANNDISNLEYVTRSENLKHSYEKLGRTPWNKKL